MADLVADVITEVKSVKKPYSYLIPDSLTELITIGVEVLVPLRSRVVKGWVTAVKTRDNYDLELYPIRKFRSLGPPENVVELCRWSAWRWVGPMSYFLKIAAPETVVKNLPEKPNFHCPSLTLGKHQISIINSLLSGKDLSYTLRLRQPGMMKWLILGIFERVKNSIIVVMPTKQETLRLYQELKKDNINVFIFKQDWARIASGNSIVLGNRDAVFAPLKTKDLGAIIVFDPLSEHYFDERSPTWNAPKVAHKRSQNEKIPVVFINPTPGLWELENTTQIIPDPHIQRRCWAPILILEIGAQDPTKEEFPSSVTNKIRQALKLSSPVAVIVNKLNGSGNLFCKTCFKSLSCSICHSPLVTTSLKPPFDELYCPRCDYKTKDISCECKDPKLKLFNKSATKLAQELQQILKIKTTLRSHKDSNEKGNLLVGTSAILNQEPALSLIYLPYFDQIMYSKRFDCYLQALRTLSICSQKVLAGKGIGVIIRTRYPNNIILKAAQMGRPEIAIPEIIQQIKEFFPKADSSFSCLRGSVDSLTNWLDNNKDFLASFEVLGPSSDGLVLIRGDSFSKMCDVLNSLEIPNTIKLYVEPKEIL